MSDSLQLLSELSDWRVLLDITVFAAFFYTVYRTLRASGTWKIAVGLSLAPCSVMAHEGLTLPLPMPCNTNWL